MSPVFTRLKEIIAEIFDVDEDEITLETSIKDDLNADSFEFIQIRMDVEDEFEVEIPDDAWYAIDTVSDLIDYIKENS